ncbi:hypothetical protein ACJIZ3_005159 [Penstemon smallii]|uniref:Uncharacterized protein n=1 Tax=Penstemon smallii TaxID=265156 RepID=A0ABD3S456_9LAMI
MLNKAKNNRHNQLRSSTAKVSPATSKSVSGANDSRREQRAHPEVGGYNMIKVRIAEARRGPNKSQADPMATQGNSPRKKIALWYEVQSFLHIGNVMLKENDLFNLFHPLTLELLSTTIHPLTLELVSTAEGNVLLSTW